MQLFPRDTLHDSLSGVYQCQTTVFGKEPLMITSLPILVQIQSKCQLQDNKTGTSQVGAISKAQVKSKGETFGDKKI